MQDRKAAPRVTASILSGKGEVKSNLGIEITDWQGKSSATASLPITAMPTEAAVNKKLYRLHP